MKKSQLNNLVFILIFSLSQSIIAQIVISNPQLGFTQACANTGFNEFNINFTLSQENNLKSNNQFNIELSDSNGSFSNSTIINPTSPADVQGNFVRMKFALPIETSGDGYRIRINSTSPVARSGPSNSFPAYFRIQDSQYTINNLEQTAEYCEGGGFLLTIDNPGRNGNDSPLQYPSLTYNWFREISPTESQLVATTVSYEVTEAGTYFVETNYGPCSSRSFSNRVTVTQSQSTNVSAIISSSLGNPYCISDGPTTLSASASGNMYQWFFNNEIITGATQQQYVTNEAGNYTVNIGIGSCSATASIDLVNTFTSSLSIPQNNFIQIDESLIPTVSTNANNPEFTWFFNNTIIPNETGNSIEAMNAGNYRVVVAQTTGCISSQELTFEVTKPTVMFPDVPNIPNIISPNNDGINDIWEVNCAVNPIENIIIFNRFGTIVYKTRNYANDWNGQSNQNVVLIGKDDILPVGTYFYILKLQGNTIEKTGWVYLNY